VSVTSTVEVVLGVEDWSTEAIVGLEVSVVAGVPVDVPVVVVVSPVVGTVLPVVVFEVVVVAVPVVALVLGAGVVVAPVVVVVIFFVPAAPVVFAVLVVVFLAGVIVTGVADLTVAPAARILLELDEVVSGGPTAGSAEVAGGLKGSKIGPVTVTGLVVVAVDEVFLEAVVEAVVAGALVAVLPAKEILSEPDAEG